MGLRVAHATLESRIFRVLLTDYVQQTFLKPGWRYIIMAMGMWTRVNNGQPTAKLVRA